MWRRRPGRCTARADGLTKSSAPDQGLRLKTDVLRQFPGRDGLTLGCNVRNITATTNHVIRTGSNPQQMTPSLRYHLCSWPVRPLPATRVVPQRFFRRCAKLVCCASGDDWSAESYDVTSRRPS